MKYIFILLGIFALLKCKVEDNDEITIEIISETDEHIYVGKPEVKFGLAAKTKDENDFFNSEDIEEKTQFSFDIKSNGGIIYPLVCRLWKDEDKELSVFCKTNTELKDMEFSIDDTTKFEYNSKNVTLEFNVPYLEFHQIESQLPFLYSSKKNIAITDQKTVPLEFQIDTYNEEPLFISNDDSFVHLENCQKAESNILKCEIPRDNLDIITSNENNYDIYYINEKLGYYYFPFVKEINIKYQINQEDIHFSLVKLTNNKVEIGSYITFETNVTNMDKIKTSPFNLILQDEKDLQCYFIKHETSTPLLMSCYYGIHSENYTIGVIQGFNQSNLHHKYNFVLETQNFNETIHTVVSEFVVLYIRGAYPETLDFTEKDSYEIFINTELNNITLIENGEDLECKKGDKGKDLRICTVPKTYFKDKKNGYYLFQHKAKEGDNIINFINYEAFGVKVIFEKENPGNSAEISKYSFGLFILISLLVL